MFYDEKKLQWVLTGVVSFGQKKCGVEGFPGEKKIQFKRVKERF